jgi:hypothetical protein
LNDNINFGIKTLFPAGALVELRIPSKSGTVVGYFTDHDKLAEAIAAKSGKVQSVYYTLNRPDPTLYDNCIGKDKALTGINSTGDNQIVSRQWLLVYCDPVRVDSTGTPLKDQKVSSTDEEKAQSLGVIGEIYKYLKARGWAIPTSADSGNGYHLLYNLGDMPSTPELTATIKNVLQHLAAKFNTAFVNVDTTVYNPSRITKAYGSMACKGPDTDDRPHRESCIRKVGSGSVTLEQLLAIEPPEEKKKSSSNITIKSKTLIGVATSEQMCDKMEEFFDFYSLDYKARKREAHGWSWQLFPCPFNDEHDIGEVGVSLNDDGGYGFKCFHNSCQDNHWQEFRAHLENTHNKKFFFTSNVKEAVPAEASTKTKLTSERASGIKPEVLSWLWPGKVPFGKLTLFVGHPSMGKGMATMYLAACATTGIGWADCPNTHKPMEVYIISSEDAGGDTLVPRLMAAKADLDKIHIFRIAKTPEGEKGFSMDTDLPALREMLESNPDIKLIIIDPVMNHLGKLKGNSEQELRSALTPLGKLAEKFNAAIVLVTHYNKTQGVDQLQRVGGAMAMVGAVRIAWSFMEEKEDGTRKMLPIKTNLAKDLGGLEYEIVSEDVEIDGQMVNVGRLQYGKPAHGSVEASLKPDGAPTKIGLAVKWLEEFMADGEQKAAKEIIDAGNLKGHEDYVIKNAYKKLGGLKPVKATGLHAGWLWQIPVKYVKPEDEL